MTQFSYSPLIMIKLIFNYLRLSKNHTLGKKKQQRHKKKKNTRAQIISKVFRHTLFSGDNYNQQKSIFDTELLMRCGIA